MTFCLQIRLDQNGRKIGGREGEYHTPQSQKLVQDKQGTVMQIDLGAAMSQMGDMEREMQTHEGCRCGQRALSSSALRLTAYFPAAARM